MGRKASPAITTSTGPLYLIPLTICNEKARTLTVCDSCLAFSNRFCKVYSERSCLKCVLNNTVTSSLGFSKE